MATFEITMSDESVYEVDALDEASAESKLQAEFDARRTFPQSDDRSPGGIVSQSLSGVNEGLANTLGFPVDLVNAGLGLGMKGVNAVAGTELRPPGKPFLGSWSIKNLMRNTGTVTPESGDPTEQFARRVGRSVGASVIPAGGVAARAARPVLAATGTLASGLSGGAGAATAQRVFPDSPAAEMVGELAGGLATGPTMAGLARAVSNKRARGLVPTTEQLKVRAGELYDDAERLGATANRSQTTHIAAEMRRIATREGLISPTGRISEAYPKAREAIRLFDDYAGGQMTVKQMKAVRKTLTDALGSVDGSERRIAAIMLRSFDRVTSRLAPQLSQGNRLYSRAMKAETLDTLDELAEARSGQFTGSGLENARRTEYRGLERNIIKGREPGFTPLDADAVRRVAQGTPTSRAFRNVGRMAPTGPATFMSSAAVPAAIGHAIGGPVAGAAAAAGVSGAGYGAREIASQMGRRAAENASLIARSGGPYLPRDDTVARVVAALLAQTAANAPD
jgi:hypothetical protein